MVYQTTEMGLGLIPVLVEIAACGARFDPDTAAPKAFLVAFDATRDSVIRETVERLGKR